MQELIDRILIKTIPEPNSGCWLWMGSVMLSGYSQIKHHYKNYYCHRIMYENSKGKIPKGLEIDHTCSTPCCVNPDHLEAVTHSENNRRIWARGRSSFQPELYGKRGSNIHSGKREKIRELHKLGFSCIDIQDKLNIGKSSVNRILRGLQ